MDGKKKPRDVSFLRRSRTLILYKQVADDKKFNVLGVPNITTLSSLASYVPTTYEYFVYFKFILQQTPHDWEKKNTIFTTFSSTIFQLIFEIILHVCWCINLSVFCRRCLMDEIGKFSWHFVDWCVYLELVHEVIFIIENRIFTKKIWSNQNYLLSCSCVTFATNWKKCSQLLTLENKGMEWENFSFISSQFFYKWNWKKIIWNFEFVIQIWFKIEDFHLFHKWKLTFFVTASRLNDWTKLAGKY